MTHFPNVECQINGYCTIHLSENPEKVAQSLSNVLPNSKIKIDKDTAKTSSNDIESLVKIFETIHSRKSQRVYFRRLEKNLNENSTWFYLNKQAAFVGTVSLCDNADESPLGPIKIILESRQIEQIIRWLVGDSITQENSS